MRGRPQSNLRRLLPNRVLVAYPYRAFLVVLPIGPFSVWQRLSGTVFSAGAGSFNLATGAFTRTGVAINQIGIYGVDSIIMASVRAAPAAIEQVNP